MILTIYTGSFKGPKSTSEYHSNVKVKILIHIYLGLKICSAASVTCVTQSTGNEENFSSPAAGDGKFQV